MRVDWWLIVIGVAGLFGLVSGVMRGLGVY